MPGETYYILLGIQIPLDSKNEMRVRLIRLVWWQLEGTYRILERNKMFKQLVVRGIAIGALYKFLALSIILIYKATDVYL